MVCDEHDLFSLLLIPYLDPSQRKRIVLPGIVPLKGDDLVLTDVPVLGNSSLFDDPVVGIAFLPRHEEDACTGPPGKEGIVGVTPVHGNDGALREGETLGDVDLVDAPFGDVGKDRKIPVMVKQEMQLHRSLRLAVGCPVKERDAEFDEGGVEAEQFVLEAELLPRGDSPALVEELVEYVLVKLPRPLLIGIG